VTQHLLAEEGIKYTLDFFHDDQPMPLKVRKGRLISLPYMMEVNDVPVLNFRRTSPERYLDLIKRQFDQLYEEGAASGTVMCIPLHPYLIGQPHRIKLLEDALDYVTSRDGVWLATGREIADWYYQHSYDEVSDWLTRLNGPAREAQR
jgi:hypothetical protein